MVEPIMFVAIGFLIAGLLVIGVIPLVHARAERLTMRRMEAMTPLSMVEIQAEKDQLRAEFAMSTRRLEMAVEQLKAKTTNQLTEIGKKSDAIGRLKLELGEKTAALFALEAKGKQLTDELLDLRDDHESSSSTLAETERALANARAELAQVTSELNRGAVDSTGQRVELLALRAQSEALKGQIESYELKTRELQERLRSKSEEAQSLSDTLAKERARKREALLIATERELARIQAQVRRKGSPLRAAGEIGLAVGEVVNAKKMAKHFALDIRDGHFTWARKVDQIAAEAKLDGIYVIRTSVPAEDLGTAHAVQAYKDLSRVERAFRSMKTVDLEIRPIRHWSAGRVRAHVFLCMLAYHVEWHLRQTLAPLLFHDTNLDAARAERSSPVASTDPSPAARTKKAIKRNANGDRVHNFAGLIDHLGTMTRNTMRMPLAKKHRFTLLSKSTPLQESAFQLLGFDPKRVQ